MANKQNQVLSIFEPVVTLNSRGRVRLDESASCEKLRALVVDGMLTQRGALKLLRLWKTAFTTRRRA